MKKLLHKNLDYIIAGTSVLGGGGGGKLSSAKQLIQEIIQPVLLKTLSELSNTDLVITVFGVGGLKSAGNAREVTLKNISVLEKLLGCKPSALIPVEIGPMSVANVLLTASLLNIPVVDADLVGFRAAPEIYLEAISLSNINRFPIVASNGDGDTIILSKTTSLDSLEKTLRTFSAQSRSKVYVAGYPMTKKQLQVSIDGGSVSFSENLGKVLSTSSKNLTLLLKKSGIIFVDAGKVMQQKEILFPGFTAGELIIQTQKTTYSLFYKNEFIVLCKDGQPIITCPDSIFAIDVARNEGVNNGDNNVGKKVMLFGKKAIPIWRTLKGRKLFSPKKLGFDFKQKLL